MTAFRNKLCHTLGYGNKKDYLVFSVTQDAAQFLFWFRQLI